MNILDQLNARLAIKKQESLTALDLVAKAAENYALIQKYGVKGRSGRKHTGGLNPKDIENLRTMRDINEHGAAISLGAKMLGRDDLAEKSLAINRQHEARGYLTPELNDKRRKIYTELMDHAKATLSPEDYKKFYGSY